MIRNKYKGIDAITTLPLIVDGKKLGSVVIDAAYREAKFHMDVNSEEYKQFMAMFNKVGLDGFAITYNTGGNNEEVR